MKFSRLAALVVFIFPINYCLLGLNIDSLVVEAENQTDKVEAFKIYRNLGLDFLMKDPDTALFFANKSLEKAKLSKERKPVYFAETLIGKVYRELGENEKAKSYLFNALDSAKADSNFRMVSSIYNAIGELHRKIGEYNQTLETYNLAIEYAESIDDKESLARYFNNIGLLMYYLIDVDPSNGQKAMDYLKQAYAIKSKIGYNLSSTYHNLSLVYSDLGIIDSTHKYIRLAIKENKREDNFKWLFLNYLEYTDYYIETNNPLKHKLYLDSAITLYKSKNLFFYTSDLLHAEAAYFNHINVPSKAINKAKESINISLKDEGLELILLNYHQLEIAFTKTNQLDSANKYFKKYNKLKTEMLLKITSAEAKESVHKIDSKLKEQQIELLNEKNKYNELQAKSAKRNVILLSIALALVLIIVSIVFYFIQQKRKLNQKLNDEALVRVQQEAELKQLNAVLKAQEEEKNKISSELHDHIGGSLAALKMRIDRIDNNQEWQNDTIELVDQIAKEVRNISHLLSANKILKIGLKRALVHLASHFESGKTQIKTFIEDLENELAEEMKINIFRIIQELFTNVQKHAEASTVFLQIVKDQNFINISVEDNGVGFDSYKKSLGIGLDNINDRVKTLKGEIEIDSKLGKGTSVTMQIPLVTEKV